VASHDGATLKVTELFSTSHSTANVGLWRLHGCVLDFIHVAEIDESIHLKGCPHTKLYFWPCSVSRVSFILYTIHRCSTFFEHVAKILQWFIKHVNKNKDEKLTKQARISAVISMKKTLFHPVGEISPANRGPRAAPRGESENKSHGNPST
jgi:hypothetical protein